MKENENLFVPLPRLLEFRYCGAKKLFTIRPVDKAAGLFIFAERNGKQVNTVEPIRDKRDVYAIKKYLMQKDEKYYIMFITGIYLGLRINEILKMTVGDVKGRKTCTFRQSKTNKEIMVAYNTELLKAYKSYCEHRTPDEALIPNPYNEYKSITRDMAYKILHEAAEHVGIKYPVGTHTMRKTCGYHYYRQTKDIATLQIWFNHSTPETTLKYIGVTRDSVLDAMLKFKI